jgi:VanZ family protein
MLCLAIFIESSFSSEEYPKIDFELSDKIVHFIIYFVLFIAAYYSFVNQDKFALLKNYPLTISLIFTAVYGASDEFHQYFVPGRSCEFYDWVADFAGGLFAVLIIIIYKKISDKKNKLKNTAYDTVK